MPEVDLVFPRAFVEFANPDDESEVMRCDLTWLTSSYHCIFGQGCKGIYKESPDVGCCALGAHFADKDDEKRVADYVGMLDETLWQFRPAKKKKVKKDDWIDVDEEGERKTMVVEYDGQSACIFHNRNDFHLGAGCALHALAFVLEKNPLETKPDVCWQLPIRRTFRTVKRPGRQRLHRGLDQRVRPPRLGAGRPRPRLVLHRQHRGAHRARAALRDAARPSSPS